MAKLKFVAGTKKEFEELVEDYLYLAQKFLILPKEGDIWIQYNRSKTDESSIEDKNGLKRITIKPSKGKTIDNVFETDTSGKLKEYPIFHIETSKTYFKIGLSPKEGKNYLFTIQYTNP